jgi:hypothetical protein
VIHRLNRGGDRQANRALYVIAISRMAHDPRTWTYVDRRTAEGLSKKESSPVSSGTSPAELYKVLTRPKTRVTQENDLASAA